MCGEAVRSCLVASTYAYATSDDLASLQSEIDGSIAYCSVEVSSASSLTGNGTCVSPATNLGFQLSARFPVCPDERELEFRVGPDYGRGNGTLIAGSLAGTGEFHRVDFDAYLTSGPTPGAPSQSATEESDPTKPRKG